MATIDNTGPPRGGLRFDATLNVPTLLTILAAGLAFYGQHVRLESRVSALEAQSEALAPLEVQARLVSIETRLGYIQARLDMDLAKKDRGQ